MKQQKQFLFSKQSKIVHNIPAPESCNTDQILRRDRQIVESTEGLRQCKRCFAAAAKARKRR